MRRVRNVVFLLFVALTSLTTQTPATALASTECCGVANMDCQGPFDDDTYTLLCQCHPIN